MPPELKDNTPEPGRHEKPASFLMGVFHLLKNTADKSAATFAKSAFAD